MKPVTLKVDGMHCGHCVRAVGDALRAVEGTRVDSVQLGKVELQVEDSVSMGVLIDAVSDAGYEAQEEVLG